MSSLASPVRHPVPHPRVSSGRFATRAEAVRSAIEQLLDAEHRREIGRRIVQGYPDVPQTDAEVGAAAEAALRSMEEEPW